MNLDDIIEHHVNAMGGREALESLQRIQVNFHLIEATFEADGAYYAARLGRMRVDIFIGGRRVFTEGLSDTKGWQLSQNAEHGSPSSPAGSIALMHGIEHNIFGLHELAARGHQLELVGRENVDGVDYYVIKLTYADGHTLWRYVNPTTWLIERSRERKALHPDVDPTETTIETRLTDFRDIGKGIKRAFHETQVDLSTNALLQTTITQQIIINPILDPTLFECP